jgi:hypothetical protein
MEFLLFLKSNWLLFAIIVVIAFIFWAVRNIVLALVEPTFGPVDLGTVKLIDHDAFRAYTNELIALGFRHYGDFNLKEMESPFGPEVSIPLNDQQTDSVFIDGSGTIIAYISKIPNSGRKELLEFSTDFEDGTQLNSRNIKKISTIDMALPTVVTEHYPECRAADLLEFHKESIKFGQSSKPRPVPADIMEKKIEGIREKNEYNRKKGILVKNRSGKYYKMTYRALFKSIGRGIVHLLSKPVPHTSKKKTYLKGYGDTGTREMFKRKKIIKRLLGVYFIFPFSAVVYKFFFMHPDLTGYFLLLWFAALMAIVYAVFIGLPPDKTVLRLAFFYFVLTGVSTYINLWSGGMGIYSILQTILLIGLLIMYSKYQKKKQSERSMVPIISIALVLMVFLLFGASQFIVFIHSFRHMEAEEVKRISIYGYEREWGKPFHFSQAEPEVEIIDKSQVGGFVSSLGDSTPYSRESGGMKGEYVVRLEKEKGTVILFVLGKKRDTDKGMVTIGFITAECLAAGKFFGSECGREYQGKDLFDFLQGLNLKKWITTNDYIRK